MTKLIGVFVYHRSRASGVIPKLYQAHVAQLLLNSNEEVYRLQLVTNASEFTAGTGKSIVACSFLGHLYTPNASTVSDLAKAPELVLEDAEEDEEELAAESTERTEDMVVPTTQEEDGMESGDDDMSHQSMDEAGGVSLMDGGGMEDAPDPEEYAEEALASMDVEMSRQGGGGGSDASLDMLNKVSRTNSNRRNNRR